MDPKIPVTIPPNGAARGHSGRVEISQLPENPNFEVRLAEQMKAKCGAPIEPGPPTVYKLPVVVDMKDTRKNISKCHVGHPTPGEHEKVLMVLGATGAGKSTTINGMVNYILGVEWKDDFRFKLITDETGGKSQAHSQTQGITAYTFHKMEGSRVPYALTVIDTPGFGDTRGLKRDKEITSKIKEFFSIRGEDGIDHLDGIGFVTQASLARLTPTQQYIFDSILSTFGKDIASNIFMLITFADGNKPPVLAAINEAEIPFAKHFKLNNSALFVSPKSADTEDEEDEDEGNFAEMFWKMGLKSFKNFYASFDKVESKSLQLTKEVLQERQKVEANIQGLQRKVKTGLSKIDELHQEKRILKTHESEIEHNKNFRYTVKFQRQRRVDLAGQGIYVTNCLDCNFTCHESCAYSNNEDKHKCSSMDNGGVADAKCTICSCRGHWKRHVNNPYRFEDYEEEEVRTNEHLQKRYGAAVEGKNQKDIMIANMEKHLEFLHNKVLEMIQEIRKSLNRLDEIALRPNPLTEEEYIELLIQSEKDQARPGYKQRIQYYEEVKQQAMLVSKVKTQEGVAEISQSLRPDGIGQATSTTPNKHWWEFLKFW